jgi:hypothetical protein
VNRERSANAYGVLEYFTSKFLAELPMNIFPALLYACVVYFSAKLNKPRCACARTTMSFALQFILKLCALQIWDICFDSNVGDYDRHLPGASGERFNAQLGSCLR